MPVCLRNRPTGVALGMAAACRVLYLTIWNVNSLILGEFASDKKLGAAFGNNNPTLYKKNFKLE